MEPGGESKWSLLPLELLELISMKLRSRISDYIHFRLVCKQWRTAARPAGLLLQLPPLALLPYDPFDDALVFLSLPTNSFHTISVPEARNKAIIESSNGWLVMADMASTDLSLLNPLESFRGWLTMADVATTDLSLLNPVARTQILLPPLSSGSPQAGEWFDPFHAFLSSSPNSTDGDCVVIIFGGLNFQFCRPGDDSWTLVETNSRPYSIAYRESRFYVSDQGGNLSIYDAETLSLVHSEKISSVGRLCFLETESGAELLMLVVNRYEIEMLKIDLRKVPLECSHFDGASLFWSEQQSSTLCSSEFPACGNYGIYRTRFRRPICLPDFCAKVAHRIEVIDLMQPARGSLLWESRRPSNMLPSLWFTPTLH